MKTVLLATILLLTLLGHSQNTIALPEISNYPKHTYRAGAQNRQILQDRNGILYFANNEGVLTFDGVYWKTYPLPNKSIVRSIAFGPDNKLYAGGQDEFGYFTTTANGQLAYHSLRHLVPKAERSFTDVWQIFFHKGKTFFQTSDKIFQISGTHCSIYQSIHWRFMGHYGDRLLAQDFDKGLLQYQNGVWTPFISGSSLPSDLMFTSITALGKDSALLTSLKHGVYTLTGNQLSRLNTPFLNSIASQNISGSTLIKDNQVALVTNLAGCFIIDWKGALIQSFSRKEGLQDNNILEVFLDREKNLWLGLENGIDYIAHGNAIKHIYPDPQNEGSGYAALIHGNDLFLGTSNGLYKVPLHAREDLSFVKGDFQPVANTKGQVWNLSEVNGQLLMGHHEGAYVIGAGAASLVDKSSGFWTFQPFSNVLPSSTIVSGTYHGVNFYEYRDGRVINKGASAQFESSRFVLIDNGNVWVSHPYKGIFKVQRAANGATTVSHYTAKEGIQSVNNNYIFRIQNRIVAATEGGILEYNAVKDRFEPSAFFNGIFKNKAIRYLKEDPAGNIWFVFDKILGVVDMSGPTPQIIYLPELTNKFVSGFELVYPVNSHNVFIGGERGFYHINFEQYKKNKYPLQAHIRTVKALNEKDSLLFGGYWGEVNVCRDSLKAQRAEIDHSWNTFRFEFSSTVYGQQPNIEYAYYLKGFDDRWSGYAKRTEKEYTNLPAGTYTFQVKARDNLGNESPVSSYTFTVLPPWYLSPWAGFIYAILAFSLLYYAYIYLKKKFRNQRLRYEEEQKRLQYLHQLEMEKTEKEIIKLKNEKLESEIQHKNKELASSAMHLVQKGELIGKIKEEILRLKKTSASEKLVEDLKKLIKILGEEEKLDDDWEHFAMHFDKVHSDFLIAMKEHYPALTANELKLCAYLRMNLSSKEIAQLMNISVRGVEISRYRLRKKLGIPTETNLFNFLLNFHSAKPEETTG